MLFGCLHRQLSLEWLPLQMAFPESPKYLSPAVCSPLDLPGLSELSSRVLLVVPVAYDAETPNQRPGELAVSSGWPYLDDSPTSGRYRWHLKGSSWGVSPWHRPSRQWMNSSLLPC